MKRYMVFSFSSYYPSGGMNDFSFSFDDNEEFEENFNEGYDYYHIFDTLENRVITSKYMMTNEVKKWVKTNIK